MTRRWLHGQIERKESLTKARWFSTSKCDVTCGTVTALWGIGTIAAIVSSARLAQLLFGSIEEIVVKP